MGISFRSERLLHRSQCCHYTYRPAPSVRESDELQIFGFETQKTRLNRDPEQLAGSVKMWPYWY
jgi:hypothetical protein